MIVRPISMQWLAVVVGLGLAVYLAVAGTIKEDFDYTYVALTALGLVGFVLRSATEKTDNDDDEGAAP